MTGTPELIKQIAQLSGYKAFDAATVAEVAKAVERVFGTDTTAGRVSGDNFKNLGATKADGTPVTIRDAITAYAEQMANLESTLHIGRDGVKNTRDIHIVAINAVAPKEDVVAEFATHDSLGTKRRYVVTTEKGEVFEVNRFENGKPVFEEATAKYTSINLSETGTSFLERVTGNGVENGTIVIILEGKSIGGDFPANRGVSYKSFLDASRADMDSALQLHGRGQRVAGQTLLDDGMIVFGTDLGRGTSAEQLGALRKVLSANTIAAQKDLLAEGLNHGYSSSESTTL